MEKKSFPMFDFAPGHLRHTCKSYLLVMNISNLHDFAWIQVSAQFAKAAQFTNHTKDSEWENLAQHRTIACLCTLFKAYSGEQAWKAIRNRLQRPYYLNMVEHVRKIRDRKQRMDIRKCSFVNRIIKNWNQLPAERLGTFPCKPKIFRNRVRKTIVNGVKWMEQKFGEVI